MERIDALGILGLADSATDAEINAAYHGKVSAIQLGFKRSKNVAMDEGGEAAENRLALVYYRLLQQLENIYALLGVDPTASESIVANEPYDDVEIPNLNEPGIAKKIILPAMALMLVIAGAGLFTSGLLDDFINSFSDIDPVLVAAQREEAQVLMGDILVLKSHLDNAIDTLDVDAGEIRQSLEAPTEDHDVDSLPAPTVLWADYVGEQISTHENFELLPGELDNAKKLLLEDHTVVKALTVLNDIKLSYQGFTLCFDQLAILGRQQLAVSLARTDWKKHKTSDLPIAEAEALLDQQQQHLRDKTICDNLQLTPQALAYFHDATQQTLPLLALMEKVRLEKKRW